MILNGRMYDVLKAVAQIWLPALGALYFSLSQIWGLPSATEVVGTITVVDTFLGVILGISTAQYRNSDNPNGRYVGDVSGVVTPTGQQMVNLEFNAPPEQVLTQNEALFKVKQPDPPEGQHRA